MLRWISHALMGINLVLALGMLLVYATPYLDPRWAAPLALLGFGYYPLLLGLLLCSVLWILRWNIRFLLTLVVLVLGWRVHERFWKWPVLVGFTQENSIQATVEEARLRKEKGCMIVASYNVGTFRPLGVDGSGTEPETKSPRDYLVHLMGTLQPDIVGLQDFISWDPQHFDVLRQVSRDPRLRRGSFVGLNRDRKVVCFVQQEGSHRGNRPDWFSGLGLWTRGVVLDFGYLNLGEGDSPTGLLWADLLMDGDTLRALNVHLASNQISSGDLRPVRALDLQSDTAKQSIFRIFRKIAGNARLRALQAEMIHEQVNASPHPVVLMGDFNDLPHSFAVGLAGQGLKDSFVERGMGLGHTYARGFPSFRIDHIFVEPERPVLFHRVLEGGHSDHYPIVAVLGR
ncbi:MAG: endonuclease/exonuclease/phosphatase family protein [Bacteroidota bacterium]